MTEPKIDAEADVEYLYRERVTDDRSTKAVRRERYYTRLKVFSENGVKDLDVISIPYVKDYSKIRDFAGRVTNPDGTTIELDKDDLYDRTLFDVDGIESHTMSFSFPQLQVGSIVEYSWSEVADSWSVSSFSMLLREKWPTHTFRLEVIPSRQIGATIRSFNCEIEFEQTKDTRFIYVARDLPADIDEPYSVSDYDVKPWILLRYFWDNDLLDPKEYWTERADSLWDSAKRYVKPNQGAVKKLASELYEGTEDPEEKLRRAYEYTSNEIKNIYAARSGYTQEERDALKEVDSPGQTIRRGYGSGFDINGLFASLAIAAGYEARFARCNKKTSVVFSSKITDASMVLPEWVVAVRLDDSESWSFFDPGSDYIPFGYLDASSMGTLALIGDDKEALTQTTREAEPEFSLIERRGNFELSKWGDLDGEVSYRFFGYTGIRRKRHYDEMSSAELEEAFCESIRNRFPGCEISDFQIANVFTRNEPLEVKFAIKIPGYAEGLGKRIFFQPNFFTFDAKPLFRKENRESDIRFPYPWCEDDEIWITFPEGYQLEEASSPGSPIDHDILKYASTYAVSEDQGKMRCLRRFSSKVGWLPSKGYPTLKAFFEQLNKYDTHSVTLVLNEEEQE